MISKCVLPFTGLLHSMKNSDLIKTTLLVLEYQYEQFEIRTKQVGIRTVHHHHVKKLLHHVHNLFRVVSSNCDSLHRVLSCIVVYSSVAIRPVPFSRCYCSWGLDVQVSCALTLASNRWAVMPIPPCLLPDFVVQS